jgi:hypothetical protein
MCARILEGQDLFIFFTTIYMLFCFSFPRAKAPAQNKGKKEEAANQQQYGKS